MMRESITREFRDLEREPIIALDWDKDIAPMLVDENKVFLSVSFNDSIPALIEHLRFTEMMAQVSGDEPLESARRIVFELTLRPGYEFPLSDLRPLSDYLASLPLHPDIIWGCSRVPTQKHNVKLKIIFTI